MIVGHWLLHWQVLGYPSADRYQSIIAKKKKIRKSYAKIIKIWNTYQMAQKPFRVPSVFVRVLHFKGFAYKDMF
jgi:hypothetical protein